MARKPKASRKDAAPAPIVINQAVNIPLNKLFLSDANVRTVRADDPAAIEALAHSITTRSLLQSLMVRPLDEAAGTYSVPGGGRRLRALQLLAKEGRIPDGQPIPCIVKTDGLAEDDSLAENNDRLDLHPVDEYRAFAALKAKGMGEEAIAAAYRVNATFVRQRLRLASASPKLLDAFIAEAIGLDELMAYCITEDQARQEQVFEALSKSHNQHPWHIRKMLTESTVPADDRRALFVGLDAYVAAGGPVMRDFFADRGTTAFLQDPMLLMRLVDDMLTSLRNKLLAEGWKWVEAAVEIPYQNKQALRRLQPVSEALSKKDARQLETLSEQHEALLEEHDEDDLPDDVKAQVEAIVAEIHDLQSRPPRFAPKDMARAGVFLSIDRDGRPTADYGFVRPEDEPRKPASHGHAHADEGRFDGAEPQAQPVAGADEAAEVEPAKGLPDSLVEDLTAYRTVALRNALANNFNVAFLSVLHTMCLTVFYHKGYDAPLQITIDSTFPGTAPGLAEWSHAKDIDQRHKAWTGRLPRSSADLWDALAALDDTDRAMLFAHCASRSLNVVREKFKKRDQAIRTAHQMSHALGFNMLQAGWTPRVETYLGRVTKALILEAVREGKDEASARLIESLKKPEMAKEAQRLLDGTGWLPEPLRLPDLAALAAPVSVDGKVDDDREHLPVSADEAAEGAEDLPEFMTSNEGEGETATDA
jgi:ParB family chromosome partitioning protein